MKISILLLFVLFTSVKTVSLEQTPHELYNEIEDALMDMEDGTEDHISEDEIADNDIKNSMLLQTDEQK